MSHTVNASVDANVASVDVAVGDQVQEGQVVVVLEALKLQVPVAAPVSGTVRQVLVQAGGLVTEGAPIMMIDEATA